MIGNDKQIVMVDWYAMQVISLILLFASVVLGAGLLSISNQIGSALAIAGCLGLAASGVQALSVGKAAVRKYYGTLALLVLATLVWQVIRAMSGQ